jgi:outer membrane protein OmpA-like peptidoglycan-associated protein
MAFEFVDVTKYLARAAAVAVVAVGASACSSVPDWVDPTTWVGDSTPPPSEQDQADQQATANASSPDLANIPAKPAAPSTPDDQKALSQSLGVDRAHNQYSADALRGGTEAAAPPPGAAPPEQVAEVNTTAQQSAASPAAAPSAAPSASGTIDAAAAANATSPDQAAPAVAQDSAAAGNAAPAAAPTTQVAMAQSPAMATPPGATPAVPAVPMNAGMPVAPSDAALGFKPSSAPPLDPSVAQFVPQPIIARYQQTAMAGDVSGVGAPAAVSAPAVAMPSGKAMGGPEHMSGAVVANFDALQAGSAAVPGGAYADSNGVTPSAVVFFPGDTTILDAKARAQVRAAAQAFEQRGGQGYVRVVGHSSSRTANMSMERHLVWNFEHSQARATAVARELIRDGVPADRVLVQAVGDSQPLYYESMPKGEEGNRRADIFLQS